jgi:hypothetical protein
MMTHLQKASAALIRSFRLVPTSKAIMCICLFLFVLAFPACGSSIGSISTSTTSASVPPSSFPIKVFFSRFPDSLKKFNAVFPVDRSSPTIAVATFSIQLLIAGPTLSERSAGLFSEFNSILTGPSRCSAPHPIGGPDFTLALNMKGSKPQQGTATLHLCRATSSPGVGTDARILAEINATLKQFSNIQKVVVLTQNGHCFGDTSGQDRCLK